MINGIGQAMSSAIEASKLRDGSKVKTVSVTAAHAAITGASMSPAGRMAAEGAPVDMDRIAAIKAAIAAGDYPVDADAIAEKMLSLDLPSAG